MSCYFCGNAITGVEHIPPKSFFPKGKREKLITVPSCDIHNQEKSKEDEYIRAILLSSIKLDDQDHIEVLREKNFRALKRNVERAFENGLNKQQAKAVLEIIEKYEDDPIAAPKAIEEITCKGIMCLGLLGLLNKDTQEEIITQNDGTEVKTASFAYDKIRFDNFFECMARGIYFDEMGKRSVGSVNILAHTFLRNDALQKDKDLSRDYLQHFDHEKSKGSQKEYFHYEGANKINPQSGEINEIFFNFCIFNKFYFTAIFPLNI